MSSRYLLLSVVAIVTGTVGFILASALLAALFGVPLDRLTPVATLSTIPIALGQILMVLGEKRGPPLKFRIRAIAVAVAIFGCTVLLLLEAIRAGFVSKHHLGFCIFVALVGSSLFSYLVYIMLVMHPKSIHGWPRS